MNHPQTGGSYSREKDGSLKRIEPQADLAPESPAEQSTETEAQPQEETTAKKGKA